MPTLLVADDNRLSRELVRDVLESADCRVLEASNGQEAWQRIQETNLDLVLIDLEMPLKDGFAVLEAIRSDPRFSDIPVMAVTAKAMQFDRARIVEAGFDRFLIKPINNAELRRHVSELLSAPRQGEGR